MAWERQDPLAPGTLQPHLCDTFVDEAPAQHEARGTARALYLGRGGPEVNTPLMLPDRERTWAGKHYGVASGCA